jgi:hypothetical protein
VSTMPANSSSTTENPPSGSDPTRRAPYALSTPYEVVPVPSSRSMWLALGISRFANVPNMVGIVNTGR